MFVNTAIWDILCRGLLSFFFTVLESFCFFNLRYLLLKEFISYGNARVPLLHDYVSSVEGV